MNYRFLMPVDIQCGAGVSDQAGEALLSFHPSRVMIVTDQGVRMAGLLKRIENSLEQCGLSFEFYDDVEPNPSAESIMNGLKRLRESGCDAVLAVGGGSSIDTAKGIAIMANNPGDILDYEGVGKIGHPGLPLVVIPTTAGTGSEATASTIVTNTQTSFKAAVISPYLFPNKALLDPELTLQLPQPITAATGMDALTHAIESYTSKAANPVSEALALGAIKIIGKHLPRAYFVGTDLESRHQMLIASMMAGAAFAQSRLGNVHAISHTFGGVFQIPHGIANATLLPFVMKFNLPACPEKMRGIAEALGKNTIGLSALEAAELAVSAVIELNQRLNIPSNIKDLGVQLELLPKLVEDSMRSGNVLINPRLTKADDIRGIIERAYHGNLN